MKAFDPALIYTHPFLRRSRIFPALFVFIIFYGQLTLGAALAQTGPTLEGCPVLPADNIWNTSVENLPVDPNSSAYISTIGATAGLHPDFGSGTWNGGPIGIPTAPANGATVSGSAVQVAANASDNVGVEGVQFKLDGANLGSEVTSPPYSLSWNTGTAANGSHTLTAVARDAAGNTTTSGSVSVTVSNSASSGGSGGGGGGGGCFIATAAHGSSLHPQVLLLRAFRDEYLMPHGFTRSLVEGYYRVSPPIAEMVRTSPLMKGLTRGALWPLVFMAWLILHPWAGGTFLLAGGLALGWLLFRTKASAEA